MSTKETIMSFALFGAVMMQGISNQHETKLEEIREEYRKSSCYPRKKKKRVRKDLIANYNFFSSLSEEFSFSL